MFSAVNERHFPHPQKHKHKKYIGLTAIAERHKEGLQTGTDNASHKGRKYDTHVIQVIKKNFLQTTRK